ncbi:MAG: PepSY domain-containing protein [Caryophanon sp.]|nr:PepSY domain-containing protein [Caryophanon sp.]
MKKLAMTMIAAIALIVLTIALLQTNDEHSLQHVEQKVATAYNATITQSEQHSDTYTITFTNDTGKYVVDTTLDGTLIALTQQESYTTTETEPQPDEEDAQPASELTLDEVVAIAQARFTGQLEQYERFNSSTGGYYVLELENDEQEVEMYIHAVTGDILSIVYDD